MGNSYGKRASDLSTDPGDGTVAALREENAALKAAATKRDVEIGLLKSILKRLEAQIRTGGQGGSDRLPDYATVFLDLKHEKGWELFKIGVFTPEEGRKLNDLGVQLNAGLDRVTAKLKTFMFDRATWDSSRPGGGPPRGWRTNDAKANGVDYPTLREPILVEIRRLQTSTATELVDFVEERADRMFNLLPGTPPMIANVVAGPDAVQPLDLTRFPLDNTRLAPADFSDEIREIFDAAGEIAAVALDTNVNVPFVKASERGMLGGLTRARNVLRKPELACEDHHPNSLLYLYAAMLRLNEPFHAEIEALLGMFGEYVPCDMKGYGRARAKAEATTGDYVGTEGFIPPYVQYLKDIIRASIIVDDHTMLDLAYKALTAKYPAVSTKNRLGEPTHDVLCVIRYQGYLVEIQFHFRTVLALKSFSHAGFNILRMQTETAYDLGTIYDYIWLVGDTPGTNNSRFGLEGADPEVVCNCTIKI